MGLFDKLASMLKIKKEQINILVVGLNNSGKSTIVNHFKNPDERTSLIVPTVGFSVERFQSKYWIGFMKSFCVVIMCSANMSKTNRFCLSKGMCSVLPLCQIRRAHAMLRAFSVDNLCKSFFVNEMEWP